MSGQEQKGLEIINSPSISDLVKSNGIKIDLDQYKILAPNNKYIRENILPTPNYSLINLGNKSGNIRISYDILDISNYAKSNAPQLVGFIGYDHSTPLYK